MFGRRSRSRGDDSGWPLTLSAESVDPVFCLRPLERSDREPFLELRRANLNHLGPWDPTLPSGGEGDRLGPARTVSSWKTYLRHVDELAYAGQLYPWVIDAHGELVGQIHLFDVVGGAQLSGSVGYWVAQSHTGRGVATRAVAAVLDHALGRQGLHRVEINIRPENVASLRVVEHLGLREEGLRLRYIHVAGAWRDHRSFAATAEELPVGGYARRAVSAQTGRLNAPHR